MGTHNNSGNAVLGIAVAFQVLRHCDEDAGRKSHVEYPVSLLAAILDICQMLLELLERFVLIILPRDVRAQATELFQLLLEILCWCFDVGLDALNVLLVVHLCSRISDDANILGEEVVSVLFVRSTDMNLKPCHATYKAKERWELVGGQSESLSASY